MNELRALYDAFNARDLDRLLAALTEDVDWPNAWEGGRLSGRDAVRDYWTRQWAELDSHVEPIAFATRPDGRVDVDVLQPGGAVRHTYTFRDGLVARMDVGELRAVVVAPGEGHRAGNVEFLARTIDTPRFTCGIVEIQSGREIGAHVHDDEDDSFYILSGEMTFILGDETITAPPGTFVLVPPGVEHNFRNDGDVPVRMLNIHAPGGFDRRIGLDA